MTIYQLAPAITAILALFIGAFVFLQNKNSIINILFGLLCFSICVWLTGFSLMYFSNDPEQALQFARFGFIGVTLIPFFSYHIIVVFLNQSPAKKRMFLLYLLALPMLLTTPTKLVYAGVGRHFWGFYPIAGPLYFISPLLFILLVLFGLIQLSRYLKSHSKNIEIRKMEQAKYMLLAFFAVISGFVDYLPKYGINIYPHGYISGLVFMLVIAYAIIKYRLMDIKIVINRIMAFSLLITIYFSAGAVFSYFYSQFLVFGFNFTTFIFLGALLILAGLFFHPLRLQLQTTPDKFLFRKKYEYEQTAKELGEACSSVINTEQLLQLFSQKIKETTKARGATIHLFGKTGGVDS